MITVYIIAEELDQAWGEQDKTAAETEEATQRLAVCNMDWDRIKAQDLLVMFNSFKPADGVIHGVKVCFFRENFI